MGGHQKFIMTSQRQVILAELKKLCSHPTADEVYHEVRKRLPRISLGTVYRNLEILANSGLIQRLEWAGTQRRYDGTLESHYHLRCLGCGRVEDLMTGPFELLEDIVRKVDHYDIVGYRFEVVGLCATCKRDRLELKKQKLHSEWVSETH